MSGNVPLHMVGNPSNTDGQRVMRHCRAVLKRCKSMVFIIHPKPRANLSVIQGFENDDLNLTEVLKDNPRANIRNLVELCGGKT